MKYLVNFAYLMALILISPKIIYRAVKYGRYRAGWGQRLGRISRKNPNRKSIWIHAVSVGEVNAAKTLVEKFKNSLDDYDIVITATTDTGRDRAEKLYAKDHEVFYFPFDISFVMQRAFQNISPALCILMELELWPNLIAAARKKEIPVVVVNGRISDSSFPRYKMIKPLLKKTFQNVRLFLAQTDEYAQRFIALGGRRDRTVISGNLKYDTAEITDTVAGSEEIAKTLNLGPERLWVAGGTGVGEEKIILDVFKKLRDEKKLAKLKLAIVPRKPERFDEVADLIEKYGFEMVRYSQAKARPIEKNTNKADVILGDTMGDLRKFYSLANIVLVGRSMVPMGGSDMMESTALGKCTMFGPHTFNFKQTVSALLADKGAIEVKDADELFQMMQKCLSDKKYADNIAKKGQDVIRKNQGATKKSCQEIVKLLQRD